MVKENMGLQLLPAVVKDWQLVYYYTQIF